MNVTLQGVFLCAPAERAYDFTDESDGRRITGTTRKVYVLQAADADPVVVKFSDDHAGDFNSIRSGCKLGDKIEMIVAPGRSVRYVGRASAKAA